MKYTLFNNVDFNSISFRLWDEKQSRETNLYFHYMDRVPTALDLPASISCFLDENYTSKTKFSVEVP